MNILYSADNNFTKVLATSLLSLCVTNSANLKNIFIISQNISVQNKEKLESIVKKYDLHITFLDLPNLYQIIHKNVDIKRYSLSMFSRILIDSLLPKDIKRVIYLDCDTIVCKNLLNLWNFDLNNKTMGAVNDYRSVLYQSNLNINKNNCYINSGVLLIDLEKYRKFQYEKKIIKVLNRYNGIFEFPDNDAICMVMQNDITLLPLCYNVTSVFYMTTAKELQILRKPHMKISCNEIEMAKQNPTIVHFTSCFLMVDRPWFKNCNHPLMNEYDIFFNQILWNEKKSDSVKKSFMNKIKYFVVKIMPRKALIFSCGIIHAYLKPIFQKIKYRKIERNDILDENFNDSPRS